jgi:hypothetical protein
MWRLRKSREVCRCGEGGGWLVLLLLLLLRWHW